LCATNKRNSDEFDKIQFSLKLQGTDALLKIANALEIIASKIVLIHFLRGLGAPG
jgi:hypothetical protein